MNNNGKPKSKLSRFFTATKQVVVGCIVVFYCVCLIKNPPPREPYNPKYLGLSPVVGKVQYIPQSPRTSYQKETTQQKVTLKPSSALKSVPVSQDTTDGNLPLEMAKATQACWNSFVAKHHVFRFGDPVPKKTVKVSEYQKQLVADSEKLLKEGKLISKEHVDPQLIKSLSHN